MQTLTDEDILAFTGKQESQFIVKASECCEEVIDRLNGEMLVAGDVLPWTKTHDHVRLRPGEVSLWGGYSGHGKSLLLGQVAAWTMTRKKWLIASLEMKPAITMERMVKQVTGKSMPPNYLVEQFMKWTDDKLWIYDQTDSVKSDRILGMIHYASEELKIDHIVIDSLIKCGIGRENLEAQAKFVDRLCWAAKSSGVHIHLVHHMRKGSNSYDEYKVPSKHDFRGAAEVTDLVDNVFIVHRNKEKEEKVRTRAMVSEDDPDCILKVDKQRNGEWEGNFKFWVAPGSMQFTPDSNAYNIDFDMGEQRYAR